MWCTKDCDDGHYDHEEYFCYGDDEEYDSYDNILDACYLMIHLVFLMLCDDTDVTIINVDDEIRRTEYQKKHHGRGSKKIGHAPSLRVFQRSDIES